ncbi:MAG: tetratricopeptide repeat protein [Verrucomicrobiota bacterium]
MTAAEEHLDEGNGCLALGDLDEAVKHYQKAVETDAEFFDGWHALAMALMKLKRFKEAEDAGKETIRIQPNNQMAYTTMSLIYVRMDRIKDAEDMGSKARIISWGGKVDKNAPKIDLE